jgi:hypothetical protein
MAVHDAASVAERWFNQHHEAIANGTFIPDRPALAPPTFLVIPRPQARPPSARRRICSAFV